MTTITPKLTFIIPSIGRSSLINSLASLINQTVPDWRAIVMFDGIEPTMSLSNEPRIQFLRCEKKGIDINSAGNVRNAAIHHAETEWVAFLDDDDYVSPRYVETFLNEITCFRDENVDILIFRMYNKTTREILPELDRTDLIMGRVGISFAVKTHIVNEKGIGFIPSHVEDFIFLEMVLKNGFKIMLSPFVRYYVGERGINAIYDYPEFTNDEKTGVRVVYKL